MLAYLEEINHYDLALYEIAVDLFEQQWAHSCNGKFNHRTELNRPG
jgi:hypothetical protein